ncbi:MAG: TlpA family protein disulfide reductase [Eubacteriaceae bacterium]|nr:TlpA family protein disulfide reductase [Eubacteriaceae bacterium]
MDKPNKARLLAIILLIIAAGSCNRNDSSQASTLKLRSIDTIDLYGNSIDGKVYESNRLTVMNVWATWCSPCVDELPELQKISESFSSQGVQVVGILQDAITDLGLPIEGVINNAIKLMGSANASYTVILPDETLAKAFISSMEFFPTTFIVDSSGKVIVTEIGAHSFDDWSEIINEALSEL